MMWNKEYTKWQEGKPLTRKQAMLAQCFVCNGESESACDCLGSKSCPMYQYSPYKGKKKGRDGDLDTQALPTP